MQNFTEIRIINIMTKNLDPRGVRFFESGFEDPCRKTIIVRHYVLTPYGQEHSYS